MFVCFCFSGLLYNPFSNGHCLFMFSVLYLLVVYLSIYRYIYSCIWLREYLYLYLCICWLSSLGSCSPVVLIIPLSLSLSFNNPRIMLHYSTHWYIFLHQYVVLVRDGQGSSSFYQAFRSRERKNTSGLSVEMSSVDNFLGKVDSEKFPQNRLLIA